MTMEITLDIWLRGDNHATTGVIPSVGREPHAWTDADVSAILADMLRAIERAKNPEVEQGRPVSLRGFSWIVNPFEGGGVVIALELSLGAVVAGPFAIAEQEQHALCRGVFAKLGDQSANLTQQARLGIG